MCTGGLALLLPKLRAEYCGLGAVSRCLLPPEMPHGGWDIFSKTDRYDVEGMGDPSPFGASGGQVRFPGIFQMPLDVCMCATEQSHG